MPPAASTYRDRRRCACGHRLAHFERLDTSTVRVELDRGHVRVQIDADASVIRGGPLERRVGITGSRACVARVTAWSNCQRARTTGEQRFVRTDDTRRLRAETRQFQQRACAIVERLKRGAIDGPARMTDPVALLEVDGIERRAFAAPHVARAAEAAQPRRDQILVQRPRIVAGPAHRHRALVERLRALLRFFAAGLQDQHAEP